MKSICTSRLLARRSRDTAIELPHSMTGFQGLIWGHNWNRSQSSWSHKLWLQVVKLLGCKSKQKIEMGPQMIALDGWKNAIAHDPASVSGVLPNPWRGERATYHFI